MKTALIAEIENVFNDLSGAISPFSQDEIDEVPFAGSWTAGQVAEHIFKSTGGLPEVFKGKTEQCLRPFDENVEEIDSIFLDFTIKMESPEFILPTENFHEKEELLKTSEDIKNNIRELVQNHDLALLCLGFEFPGTGYLTKYEWVRFALAHTKRHTHQLQNILLAINKTKIK